VESPLVSNNDSPTEEHITGWKHVREKTSAGPLGITIPHLEAHGSLKILSDIDTTMANL
jgi:hypothetical protein